MTGPAAASHSLYVSQPEAVAAIIKKAAAEVMPRGEAEHSPSPR